MLEDEGVSEYSLKLDVGLSRFQLCTRSFIFTGPDGVHYRWALGAMGLNYPKVSFVLHLPISLPIQGMKLVTADEEKKVIAEFHRAHHIIKKEKAKLEVQLAGMHMWDYIILTLVIVEQTRREREVAISTAR